MSIVQKPIENSEAHDRLAAVKEVCLEQGSSKALTQGGMFGFTPVGGVEVYPLVALRGRNGDGFFFDVTQ